MSSLIFFFGVFFMYMKAMKEVRPNFNVHICMWLN